MPRYSQHCTRSNIRFFKRLAFIQQAGTLSPDYLGRFRNSGSFATFAARRRAPSRVSKFGCGFGADFQAFLNRLGLVLKSECRFGRPEYSSPVRRAAATLEPFRQRKTCGANQGLCVPLQGITSRIAGNVLGRPSFYANQRTEASLVPSKRAERHTLNCSGIDRRSRPLRS